jgi:hypothetical protein
MWEILVGNDEGKSRLGRPNSSLKDNFKCTGRSKSLKTDVVASLQHEEIGNIYVKLVARIYDSCLLLT